MSKYLDENGVRKILSKVKYLGDGSTGTGTGTSDYNQLTNKPSINGIRLSGNRSLSDLGIQALGNYANASDIPTRLSQLYNDEGFLKSFTEEDPTVPDYVKNIQVSDINSWNNKSTFSGNYNDLTNKPTLFDGNYNSLTNKPSIPSKLSDLTNDEGFITTIPSEYITESELNSKGYQTSTEVQTAIESYINSLDADEVRY